jgi:asparagine synthetase B (glutamine-hydrolysing)
LRPDDLIVYNIRGEDTPRNRKVAQAFNFQLNEVDVPRDQLLKDDHKRVNDILDHIEDFDPIGTYAGVSCSLIFDVVRKDNISVVATGSGGNAWSGMYIRDRWFQISEENLLEVSVRRRLIMGYPPDSGLYRPHQQLGGGWSRELGSHDLKLAAEFGISHLIEPHLSRPIMEFGVNIPAHYCKFTKDAIQACYSGLIKRKLLDDLEHFYQNPNGQYIIARFPIVYSAFKQDIPDELFVTGGARLYDSVGIAPLIDSLGGEDFMLNRFNAKFRANEVKRQSVK